MVSEAEKKWSSKIDNVLEEERKALERCIEEIIISRARVEHLEGIKLADQGDRNLWKKKIPALLVWRQKAKKHVGKRLRSKVELNMSKKREDRRSNDKLLSCSKS